jgi:hypothetical protein
LRHSDSKTPTSDLPVNEANRSSRRRNTPFIIAPFTSPSGEIVFRVSGWLDGKRVRQNFKTHAEAKAQRSGAPFKPQVLRIHQRFPYLDPRKFLWFEGSRNGTPAPQISAR